MPKRLGKFEIPSKLTKIEEGSTNTYAKFIAEPFEAGYGHTIGNSLRRVLLSSIEGSAISSIKIESVNHEFQSVDGVVEDVTDIVLNLKKVLILSEKRETLKLHLKVNREGPVTAADIQAALALVGVSANNFQPMPLGIFTDTVALVLGRILLMLRRHPHVLRGAAWQG